MSIMVMYFMPCNLRRFSSNVGMIYFGRLMALLRVREGSRHIRIFPGLVGVLSLSLELPC